MTPVEPITMNMPVLALRGLTVFPHMNLTFDVERPISIAALERAMEGEQDIFLVTQREISVERPEEKDLYEIGTVSHIRQILRLSSGSARVMVEGRRRARLRRLWQASPYLQANVEELPEEVPSEARSPRAEALLRQAWSLFSEYAQLSGAVPEEIVTTVMDSRDVGRLADFIAQNIPLRHTDKQEILEELAPFVRLRKLNGLLARECSVLGFEHEMEGKIRDQLIRTQRDQILRTQIRVLQNELGEDDDEDEVEDYCRKILELSLEEEAEKHLLKEAGKLSRQPYGSAEASVIRNYLDVCLEMPWNKTTRERVSVEAARKVLEKDHFGLEKVKERILETIAVRQMNPKGKGQILCLVGPPGVGKTSIAISVAKALNRKLARLSLGGVRDEADIRGHRRTYIGSMPGRVIDAIIRGGSMNPLLLLDEIDKLGNDYRGDPASALLEVLDSEQNHAFRDHYMEIPVDLSQVMFVTTANTTDTIPQPLLDRMEVIRLTSYTDEEKVEIARRHLLPKQLAEHGLKKSALRVDDGVLRAIIRDYTRESGVRLLERRVAALCRKADMKLVSGETKRVTVTEEELPKFLDCQPYPPALHTEREEIGVVNGLAWTETGGEILEVEVVVCEGTGKLELTGNLGDVMKESAQAALSCIRSRAAVLGIEAEFYKNKDIHVHFPEGAVPKDGPSAGIAVTTAMLSALTDRKIKAGLAMTGEVTLRGRVLAIGGLKEKTMAALRNGIGTVLIPKDNVRDLEEIDQTVRAALEFIPVETIDQVFAAALTAQPEAAREETAVFVPVPREKAKPSCGSKGGAMPINFGKAEFVRSAGTREQFFWDGLPQFAFAGRSNVGKSSVINRLLGRKNLAYVGASPGKTTQVNYFLVDNRAYLVDLPGYGYAKVSKAEKERWGRLMESYFQEAHITTGVLIVDARHKPTANDLTMHGWFRETGCPEIVVANKLDKLKKSQIDPALILIRETLELGEGDVLLPFSAEKGTGKEELIRLLNTALEAT